MSDDPKQNEHDRARDLAEDALGAYAKGDRKRGEELAEQAQSIDRKAVVEDAGSDPNAIPQDC